MTFGILAFVWVPLLKLSAQNQPVAIPQLAQAVDLSPQAVVNIISCCCDLEVDERFDMGSSRCGISES